MTDPRAEGSPLVQLIAKWRRKEPTGTLSELGLRAERERAKCADELEAVLQAVPHQETDDDVSRASEQPALSDGQDLREHLNGKAPSK